MMPRKMARPRMVQVADGEQAILGGERQGNETAYDVRHANAGNDNKPHA